jgi:hypothetical protein
VSCANRAKTLNARKPIDAKRDEHERQLQELSTRWDSQLAVSEVEGEEQPAAEKRATLEALRERLLERNYINNLLATIEREGSSLMKPEPMSREP